MLLVCCGVSGMVFQLAAGPKDRLFGGGIEAFGIEQRAAVMVAEHTEREFHHDVQTFAGLGSVPDDIAQADDAIDLLRLNVRQHGLERSQVTVNIA